MIQIIEVPLSTADELAKFCVNTRNEVYFMAHETNITKPISILFADLKWLRKFYGVTQFDEECDITHESLNKRRIEQIETMKKALELNVNYYDYENMTNPDGTFKMKANHNYNKIDSETMTIDTRKEIPEEPRNLTKGGRKLLETDIAKGLFVICKYI